MRNVPLTEIFVVIVMCGIILLYVQDSSQNGEVEFKTSVADGRKYLVRKLPDSQEAAEYLASINASLTGLVQHMLAKYPNSEDVATLYKKFDPSAVSEGSIDSGYTSYSVNKGEKIILCIRQRNDDFVDKNVLLYVAIHELAHIMTPEIGHTPYFWANFRFLLQEAMGQGTYTKVDFDDKPEDYCGIQIASSVV